MAVNTPAHDSAEHGRSRALQALSSGLQMCLAMEEVIREMELHAGTPQLYGDNQASLSLARNGGTWRSRHYAVKAAGLRQAIRSRWVDLSFVGTELQAADLLTKLVGPIVGRRLRKLCGLTAGVGQSSAGVGQSSAGIGQSSARVEPC